MKNENDSNLLRIDNTKRSEFVRCPQKYFLNYIKNIRPLTGSSALRYGLVWHDGLDAYYSEIQKNGWTKSGKEITSALVTMKKSWDEESAKCTYWNDYRTLENCIQSFISYVDHFAYDCGMMEIIETEAPFKIYINPYEDDNIIGNFPGIEPFYFTGKRDLLIKLNGRTWLAEHKTTGQPLFKQTERLNRSAQIKGYTYAGIKEAEKNGTEPPEGVLVNFHHLSAYKSRSKDPAKAGKYGKPKIDFQRDVQIFTEDDIKAWKFSFLFTTWQIQHCHETGVFPKQDDSCYTYGRCAYSNLCDQNRPFDELNLEGYYIGEAWEVAKELEKENKG